MRASGRIIHAASLLIAAAGIIPCASGRAAADEQARRILADSGVRGGLVVHVGCDDGRLTAALHANDSFLVHGLDADASHLATARKHLETLKLDGKVSVDLWSGRRLPYIDNLVNLVVCEDPARLPMAEILRVLAPGGVACVKSGDRWTKTVKPWPKDIDQWTHYLHGPDNNAVAQDTVVGPPKHYQWIGTPDYLRHHDHMSGLSAMVSAQGRLFYIMDLGPRWSVEMPPQWTLVARDAFNGVILWQRPIAKWHPHLWPLKNGPAQIMRRLVAEGDAVYVTLGVGEPVTALDAATGRTLRTLQGTEGAEGFILSDGTLVALVNPELDAYKSISFESVETVRSAGRQWNWDERPRRLMAIESASGKVLWSRQLRVTPGTPAAAAGRLCFHDGDKVVCLDLPSGREAWVSRPLARWNPMHVMFNPTLIAHQEVILFAGGENMTPHNGGKDTMTALSAKTGEVLWTAPHPASGYASSEDLFVANGLVWCGVTSSPRDSGVFTGRDLHTGEVRREFSPDDLPHMPHHRCHRSKATCNYILTSRTGIEFVDLRQERWTDHHWVRGSCNYGVMPCNGLLYAPPHSCACFLLAKLNGFSALAAERKAESGKLKADEETRLQRGPAYETNPQSLIPNPSPSSWPTYRHDAARSGATKTSVPADLKRVWQTDLGGRLSSLVVADNRVFVASIDAHTVYALDAAGGKRLWSHTAGARVDSPPTVWQGRVLFGSADGHVYCLRADDGAVIWRFRAAPLDQRLLAQEQVESVWPVHGSVLVRDGVVYCVAGRAMWLDGGLRLLRLDVNSGRKLSETVLDDKYPDTADNLQKDARWPNLPVALPDVLSCDGQHVYMRSQPFDLEGKRTEVVTPRKYEEQRGPTAHLFSVTGFLDDSFWHRTYWMWGRSFISGAGGWYLAGYQAPAGNILVADESSIYGFGYAPLKFTGTPKNYHLFACPKEPDLISPKANPEPRKRGAGFWGSIIATRLGYDWSHSAPLLARAMVLADQTLFVAGPPALVDETEVHEHYGDAAIQAKMAEHVAAFAGRKGAILMAVSRAEGKTLAAFRLNSPPVFDGLIAANQRLFLATKDGHVLCLGGDGDPLPPAPDVTLGPPPATTLSKPRAPAKEFEPTKSHPDFQALTAVQITPCELGYRLQAAKGSVALALKKLDKPLTRRASFRIKVRSTPGAPSPDTPGNAFLVFGDAPDEDKLVKCGFRISGKSLSITQGAMATKARAASKKADLKADTVTELEVVVDLDGQKVTLSARGESVEAPLERRLDRIAWFGCCVQSVAADFSPVLVEGR